MKSMKFIAVAIAACVLVACGGGGGTGLGPGDAPAPPAWQGAQFLVTDLTDINDVSAAINDKGVGHVVWSRDTVGVDTTLFSRDYRDGVWGPVQSIGEVIPGVFASTPWVAALPDGEALAVWRQNAANNTDSVMFSRTVGGVWKTPAPISGSAGTSVDDLKMVADNKGNAVAVWSGGPSGPTKILAVSFRNGAFGTVQSISSGTTESDDPDIAIDSEGRALAVWEQRNAQTNVVNIVAKANVGESWQSEFRLNPQATEDADNPRVAVGLNGAASVVWEEDGGTRLNGLGATDFVTRKWAAAFLGLAASGGPERVLSPEVVLDRAGITTVVWLHRVNGPAGLVEILRSARGKGANGFTFENVEAFETGARAAQIAVDAEGRVMAVWPQRESSSARFNLFANRLDPATGQWGTPELIENETSSDSFGVALAVNAVGQALAAWEQADADLTAVMANVFK